MHTDNMLSFLSNLVLQLAVKVFHQLNILLILGIILNKKHITAFVFSVIKIVNINLINFFAEFFKEGVF